MKYIRLFLIFQICLLSLISYKVSAETYDSYILKYRGDENIHIITEEEKELLLNGNIMVYDSYDNKLEIEYLEPNYEVILFDDNTQNKDWNVNTVNAQTAWEYDCYGNGVKIAVIDSGIYKDAFPENSIDEGYSLISKSNDVTDNIGHGTFVSSIICSKSSDEYTKGIAAKSKIIPIKCFDTGYSTKVDVVADAIDYAVNVCGCDVINMSFGLKANSTYLKEKIDDALSKGVILIAAVGNNGSSSIRYPAAYDGVVGVGAVDKNLSRCDFSQYNTSVDIVAPGKELYGFSIDGFLENSGTSFSAPHITAAAAIAKCIMPNITPDEFNIMLQQTADDLGTNGYDVYYGYGLLNIKELTLKLINTYDVFISPINAENKQASITIYNNSNDILTAINIFANYDNEKFESCIFSDVKLEIGEKTKICNPMPTNTVKYFLWEKLSTLKPLTISREYIE